MIPFDRVVIPDGFVSTPLQTNNFAGQIGNPSAHVAGVIAPCGLFTVYTGRTRHHLAILLRNIAPCSLAENYTGNVIARVERVCTPAITTALNNREQIQPWPSRCSEAQARVDNTNPGSNVYRITNIIYRDADGNAKHYKYTGTDGQSFEATSHQQYTEDNDFLQERSTKRRGGFDGGAMLRLMYMLDDDERKKRY